MVILWSGKIPLLGFYSWYYFLICRSDFIGFSISHYISNCLSWHQINWFKTSFALYFTFGFVMLTFLRSFTFLTRVAFSEFFSVMFFKSLVVSRLMLVMTAHHQQLKLKFLMWSRWTLSWPIRDRSVWLVFIFHCLYT